MKPIKTLYIAFVEEGIDSQYIMDMFCCKEIATITSVIFAPSSHINYRQAILEICYWHDTDCAYDIILKLNNSSIPTNISYSEEKTLNLEIYDKTKHFNNMCNTTKFTNKIHSRGRRRKSKVSTTNTLGNKILQRLTDEQEWRNIEIDLFNYNVLINLLFDLDMI